MTRPAYTGTVVATGPALLAGAVAAVPLLVLAAVVDTAAVWVTTAFAVAVVVAVSVHLGTVRVSVGEDGLRVGHGLRGQARRIAREEVAAARVVLLSRADVYGVGRRPRWRGSRVAAGPGPAVDLLLRSGERVVVGTPLADRVVQWSQAGPSAGEEQR